MRRFSRANAFSCSRALTDPLVFRATLTRADANVDANPPLVGNQGQ